MQQMRYKIAEKNTIPVGKRNVKREKKTKNKTSSPFSLFQSQISPKAALLPLPLPFSLSRFQYFALFLGKPIMRGGSAQSTLAWV
jgi:hypothetical protein